MPGAEASRVDTAPVDAAIDRHLDLGIDPFVGTAEDGHRRRARQQQVREQAGAAAAIRRRRILVGLAAATAVSLAGLVAGFLPLTFLVLSAGALGGYVYLLRTQTVARERQTTGTGPLTAAGASPQSGADGTWEPVASPQPSYMRAPRATAVPREIDSESNGPWTAERMLEQAAALRTGEDVESELGLDEYVYPSEYAGPRAVNE